MWYGFTWFAMGYLRCTSVECRAKKILRQNPLIGTDGHNDFLIKTRILYDGNITSDDFRSKFERGGMELQVDKPRLEESKIGGVFWSAFMPCPANGSDFSNENYAPIVHDTYEQLELYHRLGAVYPRYFTPTPNATAANETWNRGTSEGSRRMDWFQFIAPVIIEGLHQIGNSVDNLRHYHRLGVRYATLTWNCHNIYADAACVINEKGQTVKSSPHWGGLSTQGRDIVLEMNRLGMMVDLSHVSVDTMRDALIGDGDFKNWHGSVAPPIFSHSSAYALCPHPRNVPDDILQLVKLRNSIVMVNFNPGFISCVESNDGTGIPIVYQPNNTIHQVVRHIKYIGDLIGYEHVGLGSDFDGIEDTPRGLEDVSKYPDLVKELLRQGVDDADVVKIVGRNILRVWQEVDDVAMRFIAAGEHATIGV
ncbi:hypothetical protein K490DRAFT_49703 [Saccharata proteae CBS 121410]|uniref:Dipeptidase n=1 Tax=Saccharata proteae CBS 121410 TaxID=1314787 RepID=A0A9P4HM91_9PEZI|nr:hypothetical protein K490DRAFT_49703 [Saccharata proteae CBS 121410]